LGLAKGEKDYPPKRKKGGGKKTRTIVKVAPKRIPAENCRVWKMLGRRAVDCNAMEKKKDGTRVLGKGPETFAADKKDLKSAIPI